MNLWKSDRLGGTCAVREDVVLLNVESPAARSTVDFANATWRLKREFHVTLLNSRATSRVTEATGDAFRSVEVLRRAVRKDFAVVPSASVWIVRKANAKAIVVECDVTGAEELFTEIAAETGVDLERPPYHITLYTIGTARGIGLPTRAELERLGRKLGTDEVRTLERAAAK